MSDTPHRCCATVRGATSLTAVAVLGAWAAWTAPQHQARAASPTAAASAAAASGGPPGFRRQHADTPDEATADPSGAGPGAIHDATVAQTLPAGGVRHLHVTSAGGDIMVRATRTQQLQLHAKRTLGSGNCACTAQLHGDTLEVGISAPRAAPCQFDVQLLAPQQIDVDLDDEAGNIFVSGISGSVRVKLGRGSAVLGGRLTHLTATLDRGSLSVQGLVGDADLRLAAGNAQIWAMAAKTTTVALEMGRGNLVLTTSAPGVDAQLNLEAGSLHCDLPQAADAPLHLHGHIAHGDATVRGQERKPG